MADLIDRQAAIDAIHNYWKKRLETLSTRMAEDGEVYTDIMCVDKILEYNKVLSNFIKALPSAQERKTGRWIAPTEDNDYWECSVCHDSYVLDVDVTPQDARMFFCPNCGAKMEGDTK